MWMATLWRTRWQTTVLSSMWSFQANPVFPDAFASFDRPSRMISTEEVRREYIRDSLKGLQLTPKNMDYLRAMFNHANTRSVIIPIRTKNEDWFGIWKWTRHWDETTGVNFAEDQWGRHIDLGHLSVK